MSQIPLAGRSLALLAFLSAAPAVAQDAPADTLRPGAALIALAAAIAQDAPADTLRPGDAALSFGDVTLADTEFEVRLVQPMSQSIGTISDTYVVDEAAGTVTAITQVQIPMAGQNVADTTVFAWPTLGPISRRSTSPNETISIHFADGRATGSKTAGAATTPIDVVLAGPVFGPGSMTRIVRAVPLTEGYTAVVPSFDENAEGGVDTATLTVGATESVELPSGTTVVARLVEVTDGEATQTYAIDPETRALLRMSFSPQPGVEVQVLRK